MSTKTRFRVGEVLTPEDGIKFFGSRAYNVSGPETHPIRYVPRPREKDVERLAKVAQTEVALIFQKQGHSAEAHKMASGVIDTILNRQIQNPEYTRSVQEVANEKSAFSAITFKYGNVDSVPSFGKIEAGDEVLEFTQSYIRERVAGERAWIGGHTNFANHHASDLRWPRELAAAGAESAGYGKFRHWHGTVGSMRQPVQVMFGSSAAIRLQNDVYRAKREALGMIQRGQLDRLQEYAQDASGPKAIALLDILQDSGVTVHPHDAQIDLATTFSSDKRHGSREELLQEEVNRGNIYSPGQGRVYNANAAISESQIGELVEQAQKVPVARLMRKSGLYAEEEKRKNPPKKSVDFNKQNFEFLGLEKDSEKADYLKARGIPENDAQAISTQLRKDVAEAQTELAKAYKKLGNADGLAGTNTLKAYEAYKKKHGDIPEGLKAIRLAHDQERKDVPDATPSPNGKPRVDELYTEFERYMKDRAKPSGQQR